MPLDPFSIGMQGLSAGIGLFTGLSQKHKARKMLEGLTYPTESMPSEYLANQKLAESRANTGLIGYNQAAQNVQRSQNNALAAAQDRRAGLGMINSIQQNSNDAYGNLAVQNANARIQNERNLMNVNNQVAGVKRDLFDKNVRQKYNQDYNYAMSLMGAGNQNFTGALDRLGAGIGMGANDFFGGGGHGNYGNYGGGFFGGMFGNRNTGNGYSYNGQYVGE